MKIWQIAASMILMYVILVCTGHPLDKNGELLWNNVMAWTASCGLLRLLDYRINEAVKEK